MSQRGLDEFQLVKLTATDVEGLSDDYAQFRELVIANEESYPGIRKWLSGKVAPGIVRGDRMGYLGYLNGRPIASAVVKLGAETKFCHLKLSEDVRDRSLGELFFCVMTMEARAVAKNVHFTLPESLWAEKSDFFRSFTFDSAATAKRQYRLFENELTCRTSFAALREAVVEKLPKVARQFSIRGHAMAAPLILSIRPPFAQRILDGTKVVELRRRFSRRWIGSRAILCSGKALLGETMIADVVTDTPSTIWNRFEHSIGCSREEFDRYVDDATEVHALILGGAVPYLSRIPLSQLETLTDSTLVAPQSYCSAATGRWAQGVALAALLHGNLRAHIGVTQDPQISSYAPAQLSFL